MEGEDREARHIGNGSNDPRLTCISEMELVLMKMSQMMDQLE